MSCFITGFNILDDCRMAVSVILFSTVVALIGVQESNAVTKLVTFETFAVGDCLKAHYTTPTTGRVSINLHNASGAYVLHADYRVHWGRNPITDQPWEHILILNTQNGNEWGPEERVKDIEFTPETLIKLEICAQANNFSIVMNKKEVATYDYRVDVTEVRGLEYWNYGYDSKPQKLCVRHSA